MISIQKSPATETPEEALTRIQSMGFCKNDAIAIMAFSERGIAAEEIDPRHNVLTYRAWKAAGRQVAKGAISVPVTVWIPSKRKRKETAEKDGKDGAKGGMYPKATNLFHESQTIPVGSEKGTRPQAWSNPALIREGSYEPEAEKAEVKPEVEEVQQPAEPAIAMTVERDTHQPTLWATQANGVVTDLSETKREAQEKADNFGAMGDDRPKTCNCPMVSVVTNAACPIHGEVTA